MDQVGRPVEAEVEDEDERDYAYNVKRASMGELLLLKAFWPNSHVKCLGFFWL